MPSNNDVLQRLVQGFSQNLIQKKNSSALSNLRHIGRLVKQQYPTDTRKNFLSKQQASPTVIEQIDTQHLSRLALFRKVWEDNPILQKPDEEPSLQAEKRRLRQQIKFKGSLDKDDRQEINIGFFVVTTIFCQGKKTLINESLNNLNKVNLIELIFDCINKEELEKLKKIDKKEIDEMGHAISAFQTPNKKKKLLKYFGIFLALITGLACGISTGGAIFLLLPAGFGLIPAVLLGVLFFGFGFISNYNFFSQNFPNFLLTLAKRGGITELIDQTGKRKQLANKRKWVFFIGLASLAVGIPATAFTYTAISSMLAKLLLTLAITVWPPLPIIIVGLMSVALGITLTVSVFTATVDTLKNWDGINITDYLKQSILTFKEKLKTLTVRQVFSSMFTSLLTLIALFGLVYYRYTAGVDLADFTGTILASFISVVAFFAQCAFTINAVDKLKYSVTPSKEEENNVSSPRSLLGRIKLILSRIYTVTVILANALGNGFLTAFSATSAPDSHPNIPIVVAGSGGCVFNSAAGNIIPPDTQKVQRNKATSKIFEEWKKILELKIAKSEPKKNEGRRYTVPTNTEPKDIRKTLPYRFFKQLEKPPISPNNINQNLYSKTL